MRSIGFCLVRHQRSQLKLQEPSVLNEGTGDGIEIGLPGLLASCRILDGRHKVLRKLPVCHRLPQIHLCYQCCLEADARTGFYVYICETGTQRITAQTLREQRRRQSSYAFLKGLVPNLVWFCPLNQTLC